MSRYINEFGWVQKGVEGSRGGPEGSGGVRVDLKGYRGVQNGPEGSEESRWVLRGYNNSMYV